MGKKPRIEATDEQLAGATGPAADAAYLANLEKRMTILAQQVGWLRSQYGLLVDRFVAGEVHAQRLNWEQASQLRHAELRQADLMLASIEEKGAEQ